MFDFKTAVTFVQLYCVNGLVPSRRQKGIFSDLIGKFPDLHTFFDSKLSESDILWLLAHDMPDFGQCKICSGALSREQYLHKRQYCKMLCYKQDPTANEKISNIKQTLYNDPDWKKQTENKKIATNIKRSGFRHPMQDPVSFELQQKSSKQAYEHLGISGLRGYERYAVDKLLRQGIDIVDIIAGTTWLSQQKIRLVYTTHSGVQRYYIPDLVIADTNTIIEVKSLYTLEKAEEENELLYKANAVTKIGYKLVVWVFDGNGHLLIDALFNPITGK